jgi:hypothetical protein
MKQHGMRKEDFIRHNTKYEYNLREIMDSLKKKGGLSLLEPVKVFEIMKG